MPRVSASIANNLISTTFYEPLQATVYDLTANINKVLHDTCPEMDAASRMDLTKSYIEGMMRLALAESLSRSPDQLTASKPDSSPEPDPEQSEGDVDGSHSGGSASDDDGEEETEQSPAATDAADQDESMDDDDGESD